MNFKHRKCGNCASWQPLYDGKQPCCLNLVSFTINGTEDTSPDNCCHEHITHEEDAEEWAMCDSYRNLGRDWEILGYLDSRRAARLAICRAEGQA